MFSIRWNLNRPHHVKALSDTLGCVQASPAGLEKNTCGDLYAKAGICEEVCESVRVTMWRLANTDTVRMWKLVCLYVHVCLSVHVCTCACERTHQSGTKH